MRFFVEGGWPMFPVLLLGLAAFAVAVAHAIAPQRALFFTALGLMIGALLCGGFGTVLGLLHTFAAIAGVDPSMKATLLAQGISEAMNCVALALGLAPLWLAPWIVGIVRARR